MLEDVLLHEQFRARLAQFLENRLHALLISGPAGAGKNYLVLNLAAHILNTSKEKLVNHPHFLLIQPVNNSIGIEQIRELQRATRLKTTGNSKTRRVIFINGAETMTAEAQNALLKLLEEPPEDTILLLTENGEKQLKATVYSRLQHLQILNPPKHKIMEHFEGLGFMSSELESTYHLAGGQIGLMHKLLEETGDDLTSMVTLAKKLLLESPYERLKRVDEISKQKDSLGQLLFSLRQVSRAALLNSIKKSDSKQTQSWLKRTKFLFELEKTPTTNPNIKLLLTNLFLNL